MLIFHFRHNGILRLICLSLLIRSTQLAPTEKKNSMSTPLLLLISFDGFRWDYPDIYSLPHFNTVAQRGVRVKYIENSFATVTFPSHFTMVTGLFEETHGIVANTMFDPVLNATTTLYTMNDTKWWSQNSYSQPIWISNQLANDSSDRRSGVIAWPGCETPINGHRPLKYQAFNFTRSFESILQQIFDWFREPISTRINFGAIYYPQPDVTGHQFGPISTQMNETLKQCDNYVGQLLNIIDQDEYLRNNLNVIITSDHGMHEVEKTHFIILEKLIDKSLFSAYGGRAFANIFVNKPSNIDQIYKNLSTLENYEVYKKAQIPTEYHYTSNVRIGDILIVGRVGYEIILPGDNSSVAQSGDHGYDNRAESMHPILYAFGPAFRKIDRAEPFRNVDLYPLMSYILRLPTRPTNGSLDRAKHILIDPPSEGFFSWLASLGYFVLTTLILMICLATIFTVKALRQCRQLLYVQRDQLPVQYRLLSTNEGSINNLVVSETESDEEHN